MLLTFYLDIFSFKIPSDIHFYISTSKPISHDLMSHVIAFGQQNPELLSLRQERHERHELNTTRVPGNIVGELILTRPIY